MDEDIDLTVVKPSADDSKSSVIRTINGLTQKAKAIDGDLTLLLSILGEIRQAVFGLPYIPDDRSTEPASLSEHLDHIGDTVARLLKEATSLRKHV